MRLLLFILVLTSAAMSQVPPIEPGVSLELAKWRAAHYSDVRYKLNLTLEKMSPVLRGTMEIRVKIGARTLLSASAQSAEMPPIVLDWRKIRGHEEESTVSNVSLNGRPFSSPPAASADKSVRAPFEETNEHLIFRDGVVLGENVIKLDFTSPILTSGSAITRYVDKEDGSEYIYSLFVPSDASTAFPVFDQPDLKARFTLDIGVPSAWSGPITNTGMRQLPLNSRCAGALLQPPRDCPTHYFFEETKPISTYVFAFAAGPWEKVGDTGGNLSGSEGVTSLSDKNTLPIGRVSASDAELSTSIYVRRSQAAKFKPHAAETFRLTREAVRYLEQYFDYKFPWPKYDLVLIPEFPFGGMEHAGATFLRESSVIFPQEPTKNDYISRATLIFHETAHQWFGDTVTMRWFDDLWLKEGFATFMAYKALEKIMPEMNAWKVFYERIKQGAYQTDSTRGTTPIYQEIKNLSAAKSAYGNIVYNKAPAFLRQAEFYLGEDKFQTAVRAFLKKHEYANAGWEDLVTEFQNAGWQRDDLPIKNSTAEDQRKYEEVSKNTIRDNLNTWIKNRGVPLIRVGDNGREPGIAFFQWDRIDEKKGADLWTHYFNVLFRFPNNSIFVRRQFLDFEGEEFEFSQLPNKVKPSFVFPNYEDYGYGIFLLDEKSRDYVLKNIQNEKDPFLRSMMWGALWDSVREGELDPRVFVELVVKVLQKPARTGAPAAAYASGVAEQGRNQDVDSYALTDVRASAMDDESTVALLLNRVGTAMNYYIGAGRNAARAGGPPAGPVGLQTRLENMLIEQMRNAETLGQRITFYRALLNVAESENARSMLKKMLTAETQRRGENTGGNPSGSEGVNLSLGRDTLPIGRVSASGGDNTPIPIKTKDKFDIVTRLLILGDPEAPKLLAELEKTGTSDDAKRYAYAAKAGIPTAENKAKYWNDFINNKQISESWIEAAMGPWNSIRHSELTLPYLRKALQELPNHKRSRKIFFVNGWLGAFIGGQRSEEALAVVNKFLADNPNLDSDLRLKVLENVDLIERAVRIRAKYRN